MKPDYDIIVVGGAMTGAGLAALLKVTPATRALRIALLEPKPTPRPAADAALDLRVSALSRASEQLLQKCGAWPAVAARGAGAYQQMQVWDHDSAPDSAEVLWFDAAELGQPDLGHIVENQSVQAALLEAATQAGVVLHKCGLKALEVDTDLARVDTTDDRRISARLVVGADGGNSRVREQAGISTQGWDYEQHAVVTHLCSAMPHGQIARQRFLSTGPLALLPLADGRVSLVWSATPDQAQSLVACTPEEFGRRVTEASAEVLGALTVDAARGTFPLRQQHAKDYVAPRIALIGDAAHTVHPLAGQGVNLGFMDAAALVDVITQALERVDDIGELRSLRPYARWRKAEVVPAMALIDGIKRLFGADAPGWSPARRTGLALVEKSGPLKRQLIKRAMGLTGEVPASLRPTGS